MIRTLAVLLALIVTLAPELSAQRPNTREGFWIGFGVGNGSTGADCPSCEDDRRNSSTAYLRMGGTTSPSVLLGGELTGWSRSDSGFEESLGFATFVVSWYPSATGAFFLKGGLGVMSYELSGFFNEITATAGAASIGLGYDFRVARNFSLTPFLNAFTTGAASFKVNGSSAPTGEDITVNLLQIGLGFHWH